MFENLWHIFLIIAGFGFLILVHELGHFLVARFYKVRCPYFSIGMGVMGQMPPVVAWRKGIGLRIMKGTDNEWAEQCLAKIAKDRGVDAKDLVIEKMVEDREELAKLPTEHRVTTAALFEASDALNLGETEYRFMALPLGGYVAMEGQEDMDPTAKSEDPRAFNNQPIHARAAILSAGVVMNVIFGFLFFIIAFGMGVEFPARVVGMVDPTGPAAQTHAQGHEGEAEFQGLQPGDIVEQINGKPVHDFTEVQMGVALARPGEHVTFVVQRPGLEETLTYDMVPVSNPNMEKLLSVGIAPAESLTVQQVVVEDLAGKPTPAGEAGVQPGMVIASINGQAVSEYGDFVRRIADSQGESLAIGFANPSENQATDQGQTQATRAQPVVATLDIAPVPTLAEVEGQDVYSLLGLRPVVKAQSVIEDSPAAKAGVLAGDLLVAVGDEQWPSQPTQVISAVGNAEQGLKVTVFRDGQIKDLGTIKPANGKLGIGLDADTDVLRVAKPLAQSPAAEAGVPSGVLLTQIAGQPVATWAQAQHQVQLAAEQGVASIDVTYQSLVPNSEPVTVAVVLSEANAKHLAHASYLPAVPGVGLKMQTMVAKATGPIDAMAIGVRRVKLAGQQVYVTLARLFQGSVRVQNLRGPVGIVDEGKAVAAKGPSWYLYFLGLISINLAVLNFLPLPIVDGGHIVLLGYEKLKGQPPSAKIQQALFLAGLALLGSLFLIVTFNDIARLVGRLFG